MAITTVTMYSKSKADELFAKIVTALPSGKTTTDTVTFQDLIDMGIIVLPSP